jgi:hypothetical protein
VLSLEENRILMRQDRITSSLPPRCNILLSVKVKSEKMLNFESREQVQAAVKFATEHNVRLTILNSGHDFLARHDSPSGLSLMVGNLKGVRVSERFKPEHKGVPNVNYTSDPVAGVNQIKTNRRDAAVTFGVGVTGQQVRELLLDFLAESKII